MTPPRVISGKLAGEDVTFADAFLCPSRLSRFSPKDSSKSGRLHLNVEMFESDNGGGSRQEPRDLPVFRAAALTAEPFQRGNVTVPSLPFS